MNRADPTLQGIRSGNMVHKISLFADYVIIFLSNPCSSLKKLDSILPTFNKVSGLHINKTKLELYPIQMSKDLLKYIREQFKYVVTQTV